MAGRTVEPAGIREYSFGDYRIDLASYQLWQRGLAITLTPKVFDTLVVLIQHRDRAVTKEELLKSVWPDASVTEDSLTQSISILRKTLGDDTTHPRFITTIARRGYRFIAPVEEVAAERLAIDESQTTPAGQASLPSTLLFPEESLASRPVAWKPWVGGALLGLIVAFGIVGARMQRSPANRVTRDEAPPLRFSVSMPAGTTRVSTSVLSPDGTYILLLAEDAASGIGKIWIRSLATGQSWSIPESEGAARPFWSPDSQSVGFIRAGKLQRAGVNSRSTPQTITAMDTRTMGVSWGARGTILFAPRGSGLYSVPASGGTPTRVTNLNSSEQEVAHEWPQFLPDGDHFLYFAESSKPSRRGTWLASLESKKEERVLDVPAFYAPPGYLIYMQDRLLKAQPFDLANPMVHRDALAIGGFEFSGGPTEDPTLSSADLSVTSNGLLAYSSRNSTPQVKSVDRSGHELAAIDMSTPLYSPVLSPDGKQLLVASRDSNRGVWLVDLPRGVATRLIPDGRRSLWSPDGSQIVFNADRGAHSFFIRPTAGSHADSLLLTEPYAISLNDWSRDGRYILYTTFLTNAKNGLWILPMFGDRKPKPYLQAGFNEMQGEISPDGHWVAYVSDESGKWEVYLQSFPEPGTARILSIDGGVEPHWRKDGKELFYLSADRNMTVVPITLGSIPKIERPHVLFRAPVVSPAGVVSNQFAVSADGQQFVFATAAKKGGEGDEVTVLSSWTKLLGH